MNFLLVFLSLAILVIIEAKTFTEVKKCHEEKEDKCIDECKTKIKDTYRESVLKCVKDTVKDERDGTTKCTTEASVTECAKAKTETHRTKRAVPLKLFGGVFELDEARQCMGKCMEGTRKMCTEGCTATLTTTQADIMKKCIIREDTAEKFEKFQTCIKGAVAEKPK